MQFFTVLVNRHTPTSVQIIQQHNVIFVILVKYYASNQH